MDEMKERRKSKSSRQQISYITTSDFKKTILNLISEEKSEYCCNIHKRIVGVLDLVAQEAKYHGLLHVFKNYPKTDPEGEKNSSSNNTSRCSNGADFQIY
ncbi:hypothetical protein TNIN_99151 [Trichonephila inaurata madagascariensis]|uniref:Uncharacterized protein n=1 Tax=Trichonephila inaurata madagascariensis TaxID=2747483 RepID=A0A8X6X120_9ARAC|nr:hypothetical protein TNIN_99151 [Trichonephila inaurata madagascariensis]